MENNPNNIITETVLAESITPRNKLLPLWIKIFCWIFLVIGFLIPFALVWGIITHNFIVSLYGVESNTIYSLTGIFLVALFSFKTLVAFGLLRYRDWAVKLGIIDAAIGILICCIVIIYSALQAKLIIRLELVPLIPYFLKLRKIKNEWELASKF